MFKARPILFSEMMVEAILAGRKTMTRRVLKADAPIYEHMQTEKLDSFDGEYAVFEHKSEIDFAFTFRFPYGKIGDLLWVREAWRIASWDFDEQTCTVEFKDGAKKVCELRDVTESKTFNAEWLMNQLVKLSDKGYYKAKYLKDNISFIKTDKELPWRLARFMPREASRICLEITGIRVERLQDISEEDAKLEGVKTKPYGSYPYFCTIDYESADKRKKLGSDFEPGYCAETGDQFRKSFASLWRLINGKESWDLNPWVWVIEFKRVDFAGKEVGDE